MATKRSGGRTSSRSRSSQKQSGRYSMPLWARRLIALAALLLTLAAVGGAIYGVVTGVRAMLAPDEETAVVAGPESTEDGILQSNGTITIPACTPDDLTVEP
ncbi:MAG: hypothetical protein CSA82_00870, partial [Actinobacteria bacterium]